MDEIAFEHPTSVSEARELMARAGSVALAGGTAVMFLVRELLVRPDRLVWVGALPEMTGIHTEESGRTFIGAATTMAQLASSSEIMERYPMLSAAAAQVGNPRVRSVATVGGALVHADPRQDLLPALLVADATLHTDGVTGPRSVRLREGFFQGLMAVALEETELVTGVTLPNPGADRQRYMRFTPDSRDGYPTVGVAAAARLDGTGAVAGVDLALAGVADTPILVDRVFETVTPAPTPATVASAAELAAQATSPFDDLRGSADYKRAMTRVWVERILLDMLDVRGSVS